MYFPSGDHSGLTFGKVSLVSACVLAAGEFDRPEIRLSRSAGRFSRRAGVCHRGEGRSGIQPWVTHSLHRLPLSIENGDLLELRPARRRKREETFAVGAHVRQTIRDLAS